PFVMQQRSAPVGAEIEIGKAVIVVISHGAAQEMAGEGIQSCGMRDLRKMPLPISSKERRSGPDQQDVQATVLVVIQEGAAAADGLKNMEGGFAFDLPPVAQPCRFSRLYKERRRGGRGRAGEVGRRLNARKRGGVRSGRRMASAQTDKR